MINKIIQFTHERGIEVQLVAGTDSTAISAKAGGIGAFLRTRGRKRR